MKNQTRVLVIVAALVVLIVGAAQFMLGKQGTKLSDLQVNNIFKPEETAVSPTQSVKTESVVVNFGSGKMIKREVVAQSAYQALLIAARENNINVEAKEYKYGFLVTKIGETANSADRAWMYSVNGKPGQIAADRYVIYPGDKVEWVYKKITQ